jgi:hypothetical protein
MSDTYVKYCDQHTKGRNNKGIKNVVKMVLTIFGENSGLFYLETCIGSGC